MNSITLKHMLQERGLTLTKVAQLCSVDKATVTRWAQGKVPAERVPAISALTGIPRHELRPDLYLESGQ